MSEVASRDNFIRFNSKTAIINRIVYAQVKLPAGDVVKYDVQRLDVLVKYEGEWLLAGEQDAPIASSIPVLQSIG